jgi:hypothetical protein
MCKTWKSYGGREVEREDGMEANEPEMSLLRTLFPLCLNTTRVLCFILVRIRNGYFALWKCFIHRGQFLNDSRSSLQSDGLASRQAGESNRRCSCMPRVEVLALQLNILRFIFDFYV